MSGLRRLRPSPAMVVACIALVFALAGTSVAAIQALPKNSVGTKQIKNGAVTAAKVKAHTLTASTLKSGVLPDMSSYYSKSQIDTSLAGYYTKTQVDTNTYSKTQADARYLRNTITVVISGLVGAGASTVARADCPSGYQAIGGGVDPDDVTVQFITSSGPSIDGSWLDYASVGQHAASTGWWAAVHNNGSLVLGYKVAAICSPIG